MSDRECLECLMHGCQTPSVARGFCHNHYRKWLRYGDPAGQGGVANLAFRFWSHVEKTDGCWLWTGNTNNQGRPWLSFGGRSPRGSMKLATHIAWYLEYGQWPTIQMNHNCDEDLCIRHDHLYDGTQLQNMRDMAERGTCPAGHPRTPEHLQVRPDGTRYCKTCQNMKRRERKKEA